MKTRQTIPVDGEDETVVIAGAAAGRIVRVLGIFLSAATDGSFKFTSDSADLCGAIAVGAGLPTSMVPPVTPDRDMDLLRSTPGEDLSLVLTGAVAGFIIVELVTQTP